MLCIVTVIERASIAIAAELVDRIVAVVNEDVISLYELNRQTEPYVEKIKSSQYPGETENQLIFEVRSNILQRLIDQKLAEQELQRKNITVSENEIDNAIERIKEAQSLTDEDLKKALQARQINYEEYREQTRKQILRAKLVNQEVRSKIVITEDDIRQYYERHKEEYTGERKYHLRNIFTRFDPNSDESDRQFALRTFETILTELENGKPFDELAKTYADSSGTFESSDLGFYKIEDLAENLREFIKDRQAGEFTPIITGDFGYQIIYVQNIVEAGGKTYQDAAPEIQAKLYNQVIDEKYQAWLQSLRDRSHIKIIN